IAIVSLEDEEDHELARRQRDICLNIVEPLCAGVTRIETAGGSRLTRILSTMILGDFISVYLGLMNGMDPTPVEKIDYLKKQLQ
ncbi:MAG: SIS domain-containing protein, partial [Candidatus Latescibacterota bacterium]